MTSRRLLLVSACLLGPSCGGGGSDPSRPVSMSIGPGGGTITSADQRFSLEIPAGALTETVTIGMAPLAASELSEGMRALDVADAYRLTPDGLTFAMPVIARLDSGQPASTTPGMVEASFVIFVSESTSGGIAELPKSGLEVGDKVFWSTELEHFSDIAVRRLMATQRDGLVGAAMMFPTELRIGERGEVRLRFRPGDEGARFRNNLGLWLSKDNAGGRLMYDLPALSAEWVRVGRVGALFDPSEITHTTPIVCNQRSGGSPWIVSSLFLDDPEGVLSKPDGSTYYPAFGVRQVEFTSTVNSKCVNGPPVATPDSYSTLTGTPLVVAAPGLLANDTDTSPIEGTPLIVNPVIAINRPANGTLTEMPDGSFQYVPNAGFSGTDGFDYQAYDGELRSNDAHVTIRVGAAVPAVGGTVMGLSYMNGPPGQLLEFWPNGAVSAFRHKYTSLGELADGPNQNRCRTGEFGVGVPYHEPFGKWSLDAMDRLVVEYCGVIGAPAGTSTWEWRLDGYNRWGWVSVVNVESRFTVMQPGAGVPSDYYAMTNWQCIASDVGCTINIQSTCNGSVLYSGLLESRHCKCREADGCSECSLNSGSGLGHWNWEKAIVPVCP